MEAVSAELPKPSLPVAAAEAPVPEEGAAKGGKKRPSLSVLEKVEPPGAPQPCVWAPRHTYFYCPQVQEYESLQAKVAAEPDKTDSSPGGCVIC